MKVSMIRLNNSIQSDDLRPWEAKAFHWYQVLTTEWESGARNRMKTFSSSTRVMEYINKLHIGKYLSDDDYTLAWEMVTRVLQKCDTLNVVYYDTVRGPLSS